MKIESLVQDLDIATNLFRTVLALGTAQKAEAIEA